MPEDLRRAHWLVKYTRNQLQAASKDRYGRYLPHRGCLHILVTHHCQHRAYRIMDAVLKACQARGWTVAVPEDNRAGTLVNVEGGVVPIMLEEQLGRKLCELSEHEKEDDPLLHRKQRA